MTTFDVPKLASPLTRGASGPDVENLQRLLTARGYPVLVDGSFGLGTLQAVKAFQAQNLDSLGHPLVVDGRVGPLTWWSLTHPKPDAGPVAGVDYLTMPDGGSPHGRAALSAAIDELRAGAGEQGGNNSGPFVRKYLNGLAPEGSSWCAAFVSWTYHHAPPPGSLFEYTVGARHLLAELRDRGWSQAPGSGYEPQPGDIVVWWRVRLDGWEGHAGLVHHAADGMLFTIEGNRSPNVAGFTYVLSRMDRLLGFGHVP